MINFLFNYLKYIFNVGKKWILVWMFAPGIYMLILPFAFGNESTKKVLSYWQDLFDRNLKQRLKELDKCVKNQNKFN